MFSSYATLSFRAWFKPVDTILEPPLQTGGNAHQRCPGPAMRGGSKATRHTRSVVGVGGNRPSACAKIVVSISSVERRRHDIVPDQVIRELVLPLSGHHVGLVLVGTKSGSVGGHERRVVVLARIAGRAECMRPAEIQAVQGSLIPGPHDKPGAPPRTFVLECHIRRDIAMHVFDNGTNRGLGCELIHDTALGGPLIRNIVSALLLCNPAINGSRGREKTPSSFASQR